MSQRATYFFKPVGIPTVCTQNETESHPSLVTMALRKERESSEVRKRKSEGVSPPPPNPFFPPSLHTKRSPYK